MADETLNKVLLPENVCFGCGHENPNGLKIEIERDPDNDDRLIGTFNPTNYMIGFPGITHGGAIYTALDCMAFWTPTVLRSEMKVFWILRSANIKYVRPAHEGKLLSLSGWIEKEGTHVDFALVRTEARDEKGRLLTEAKFEVVPLALDKFKKVAGIEELPENWCGLIKKTNKPNIYIDIR
ncbi:MAG: PaaI family thioesterase [Gemmatimonadota bacterium]|nr:MAG: PaaI family thioesterase [Gemmatimonadota bacterium]